MLDMQQDRKKKKSKSRIDIQKFRKYIVLGILVLIAYLINAKFFIMAVFIFLTFAGKMVRAQIANNMFMFDPLVFFSVLLMHYWGFSSLFLFLFLTVFVADLVSGGFTDGSILNYFLFHLCPLVGEILLGRFGLMFMGNFTAILYSFVYFNIRTKFMGGAPLDTAVKAITNVVFVYLYIVFLGPIFEIIM